MDFDYKKYSLEQLDNWMHDALSCAEATPQEIYDVIRSVVQEQYYYFKDQTSRCYELLALMNGNSQSNKYGDHLNKVFICDKDDTSEECKQSWTSFWEEHTGSTVSSVQSTEEKEKIREYNLRESEYYDKRAKLDGEHSKYFYEYDRNDLNRLNPFSGKIYESPDGGKTVYARNPGETERVVIKEDKVKKWLLPTEVDGLTGDVIVNLPDDLLEAANLKEGDQVEWIDNNGFYTLRKVTKPLGMDEC